MKIKRNFYNPQPLIETFSETGTSEKIIKKYNKRTRKLDNIKKIDNQAMIQSYHEETNYKGMMDKLGIKSGYDERILETYQTPPGAFYGDITEMPESVFAAMDAVEKGINVMQLIEKETLRLEKETLRLEKEKEVTEDEQI